MIKTKKQQEKKSRYSLCFSLHLTNEDNDFWLIYFIYFSIIPFVISITVIFLYILLMRRIHRQSAYFLKKEISQRFILILWKASMIILSNIITWIPIVICSFLAVIRKSFLTQSSYSWIFITILPLNSIINVIIHNKFNFKVSKLKKKSKR